VGFDDALAERLREYPIAGIVTTLPGRGSLQTAELVHTANVTEYLSSQQAGRPNRFAPVTTTPDRSSGSRASW
jgi:hypothetical protein